MIRAVFLLAMLVIPAVVLFGVVYVAARLAIRHERRISSYDGN